MDKYIIYLYYKGSILIFLLYRGDNIQVKRYWVMVVFGAHWPGDPDFWWPTV
jgi:hypothetical protein